MIGLATMLLKTGCISLPTTGRLSMLEWASLPVVNDISSCILRWMANRLSSSFSNVSLSLSGGGHLTLPMRTVLALPCRSCMGFICTSLAFERVLLSWARGRGGAGGMLCAKGVRWLPWFETCTDCDRSSGVIKIGVDSCEEWWFDGATFILVKFRFASWLLFSLQKTPIQLLIVLTCLKIMSRAQIEKSPNNNTICFSIDSLKRLNQKLEHFILNILLKYFLHSQNCMSRHSVSNDLYIRFPWFTLNQRLENGHLVVSFANILIT